MKIFFETPLFNYIPIAKPKMMQYEICQYIVIDIPLKTVARPPKIMKILFKCRASTPVDELIKPQSILPIVLEIPKKIHKF